jgi:hypothetical protein
MFHVYSKGTESNSNLSQNMGKGKYPRIRKNQQNENRELLVTVVIVVIIVLYRVKSAGIKKSNQEYRVEGKSCNIGKQN